MLYFLYDAIGTNMTASLIRFYTIFFLSLIREFINHPFQMLYRRIFLYCILFYFTPILMIWTHMCFIFDDIFFPRWKQQVAPVIFIVGNACSGGDLVYEALSEDDAQFTHVRLWELLLGASVTGRRLILHLYKLDMSMGGSVYNLVTSLENTLISMTIRSQGKENEAFDIKDYALRFGLQCPIQDEWLLMHNGLSRGFLSILPYSSPLLTSLEVFYGSTVSMYSGLGLSSRGRDVISTCYKQAIQRHMYGRSSYNNQLIRKSRTLPIISYNPCYTLRLPSLMTKFPDAKVVCVIRDPLYTIPALVQQQQLIDTMIGLPSALIQKRRIILPKSMQTTDTKSTVESVKDCKEGVNQAIMNISDVDVLALAKAYYTFPVGSMCQEQLPVDQFTVLCYHSLQVAFWPAIQIAFKKVQIRLVKPLYPSKRDSTLETKPVYMQAKAVSAVDTLRCQEKDQLHCQEGKHPMDSIIQEVCGVSTNQLKESIEHVYNIHSFQDNNLESEMIKLSSVT